MKHREVHENLDVEGCFGCRIAGVQFSGDAMPTRKAETADKNQREKALAKDLVSFKNMVKDGKQPPRLTGSHKFEAEAK